MCYFWLYLASCRPKHTWCHFYHLNMDARGIVVSCSWPCWILHLTWPCWHVVRSCSWVLSMTSLRVAPLSNLTQEMPLMISFDPSFFWGVLWSFLHINSIYAFNLIIDVLVSRKILHSYLSKPTPAMNEWVSQHPNLNPLSSASQLHPFLTSIFILWISLSFFSSSSRLATQGYMSTIGS